MGRLAGAVRAALGSGDLEAYADLLAPDVRWGPPGDPSPPCTSRRQVLAWYQRARASGAGARVTEVTVVGDRLLVGLVVSGTEAARGRGGQATRYQVLTVRDGRVAAIVGFDQRREALAHLGIPAA
jgi:ketosteroid isomerase-like protein